MKPSTPVASPGLVRALGPLTTTAVVVGIVIGSGVFKKPQSVAEHVPNFGLAALLWILGGVLVFLGALAYAEVAVLLPRAGGNYVFLREAYGRLAGFLWGWVDFCVIRSGSLAALATIFTESLHDVLRNQAFQQAVGLPSGTHLAFWPQRVLTVSVLLALALVNVRGVRWGGAVQLFITIVKVGSLLVIVLLPFMVLATWVSAPVMPRFDYLYPLWPDDWRQVSLSGLGTAYLGILWAYHGWQSIAPVAEEVRRPQRNLPLALLGGVAIVITLYVGVNLAYYLVIPRAEMAGLKDTTVAAEFSLRLLGPLGAAAASAAVMCSVFGALNGNLLVGPRLLYAMGEDGLAPRALSVVHARYRTPALAILVLASWSALQILTVAFLTRVGWLAESKSHFDRLTDFTMFGAVIFETLAVASIFMLRRRWPNAERPYRCLGYPVVPALYMILPLWVLVSMFINERAEALAGVGFIVLGAAVYALLGLGHLQSRTPAKLSMAPPFPPGTGDPQDFRGSPEAAGR
jgi:basic amino acid/polyamine antiporter, APA family